MTYETQLSVTRWKPYLNKINRLPKVFRAANDYVNQENNETLRDIYLNVIEEVSQDQELLNMSIFDENRFTYVSLKRQNSDVTLKREKLVIDVYIFTVTSGRSVFVVYRFDHGFFIELIEFIYLSLRVEKVRRNTMHTPSNHETVDLMTPTKTQPVYLPTVDYSRNYIQIRDNGVITDEEENIANSQYAESELKMRPKSSRKSDSNQRKIVDFDDEKGDNSFVAINENCDSKCDVSPWHRPNQDETLEDDATNFVPISSV